ncbi:MAG TPA: hypothetical protein VE988_24650 [Gemmataceae bacterium]|nr:hypothetical protein [Gemmataceae bacterium]
MTNVEFQEFVLSKAATGPFEPMVLYNKDTDTLEVLVSNESSRTQLIEPSFTVCYGRESGEVTGAIITGIQRFINDIANEPPDIRFEVHNGRFKIVHLFRAIRKMSKTNGTEKTREIVVLVCKTLEEAAENREGL